MEAGGGEGRQGGGGGGGRSKPFFLSFLFLRPLFGFFLFVPPPGVEREYLKKGNDKEEKRMVGDPLITAGAVGPPPTSRRDRCLPCSLFVFWCNLVFLPRS